TPTFAIAVAANPAAGGTVVCTPNPVLSGSDSVCTATPNAGYSFVGWGGDCAGTAGATCTLTGVTATKSVTANFAPVSGPAAQPIPTLSQMGTWLLAGLLVLLAGIGIRRRSARG
ncbi:MAG TPA: IPTL-CTERM sorting domain-containing protein, partial [Casimicrobiaceae bacterium]|nr:IPTL-CTERM sorting domain-containing protein [Casimicrobiaceae bacterium]